MSIESGWTESHALPPGARPRARGAGRSLGALLLTVCGAGLHAQALPEAAPANAPAPAPEALAPQVHLGQMPCAMKQSVNLQADPERPGHFILQLQGQRQRHAMQSVTSASGAVRLENAQAGLVWLQLSNKSMLMNQKLGHRLADECMSPIQRAVAESHETQPPPSIFDVAATPR